MNVTTLTEGGAMPDYRTEAQKDREARGMVLFNGQEITREAYDRIRGVPTPESARSAKYRAEVRETMRRFSDAALAYQSGVIIGGIDREECDREKARRGL